MKYVFFILTQLCFSCKNSGKDVLITPEKIVLGNNLDIEINGLVPNTKYDVYLQQLLYDTSIVNLSKAIFMSDSGGLVDIDKSESLGGDFLGRDSLGLFYILDTVSKLPSFLNDIRIGSIYDINKINYSLQIVKDQKIIKKKEFSFIIKGVDVQHKRIEKNTIILDLYTTNNKNEITIVLGGSEGNNKVSNYIAKVLASNGHNAAAISYFGNSKQGYSLKNVPLERIDTSLMLINKTIREFDRINIVGVSRGAELALLYASYRDEIHSVFAFAPSSVVFSGHLFHNIPAWTLESKAFDYINFPNSLKSEFDADNKPIYVSHISKALEKHKSNPEIPVENINANVYLFSGKDDLLWPSAQMADMIEQRISNSSFNKEFVNFKLDSVGHSVLSPAYMSTKSYSYSALGGNRKANSYANLKYWNFLLKKLNSK